MKKILALLTLTTILSSRKTDGHDVNEAEPTKTQFDWLVGNWTRNNDKDGKKTYESWKKKSNSEYTGISYTLLDNDTIWKEDMAISKTNKIWHFAATGKEDKIPVVFELSKIDDKSFTFENKNNSFPKLIQYERIGNKFKADVSGDDMTIHFEFEKEN